MFVIPALLAGVLGTANYITKDFIAEAQANKKKEAIEKVLPPFDRLEEEEKVAVETVVENNIFKKEQAADSLIMYDAYQNDTWIGTAIETFTNKGFSGKIKLMVGFLPNGNIHKIEVLEHAETPGLGDKMEVEKGDKFPKQFLGKNPASYKLSVSRDGGDVDAITAATISSRAYCDAVQTAYNVFIKKMEEKSNE